jgi:hypothetical protein
MNGRGFRELVGEVDAYTVAFTHANLGAGNLTVVRPCLHLPAGLHLPLNFLGGHVVDFHSSIQVRLKELVPLSGGWGREGLDALFMHGVHGVRSLLR